jgi:hypothetical protein
MTGAPHPGRVTMTCPVCHRSFTPSGRRACCSDASRSAAYRARHGNRPAVVVPAPRPRRPVTVYERDGWDGRALGEQYCQACRSFMRRAGTGGCCPECDAPLVVAELIGGEVIAIP